MFTVSTFLFFYLNAHSSEEVVQRNLSFQVRGKDLTGTSGRIWLLLPGAW